MTSSIYTYESSIYTYKSSIYSYESSIYTYESSLYIWVIQIYIWVINIYIWVIHIYIWRHCKDLVIFFWGGSPKFFHQVYMLCNPRWRHPFWGSAHAFEGLRYLTGARLHVCLMLGLWLLRLQAISWPQHWKCIHSPIPGPNTALWKSRYCRCDHSLHDSYLHYGSDYRCIDFP